MKRINNVELVQAAHIPCNLLQPHIGLALDLAGCGEPVRVELLLIT